MGNVLFCLSLRESYWTVVVQRDDEKLHTWCAVAENL